MNTETIPKPKFPTLQEAKKQGYWALTDPIELPKDLPHLLSILRDFRGSSINVCTVGDDDRQMVCRTGKASNRSYDMTMEVRGKVKHHFR